MGVKYYFITAILMTLASLAWGFNLYLYMKSSDSWPLGGVMAFMIFTALAIIYWAMYSRRRNPQTSETE